MPGFTFLGFLHVWGKSFNRKTRTWFWRPKRRTCPKRFRKKLAEVVAYIRQHRHDKDLLTRILRVVRGYLNYFAINDNQKRCNQFIHEVIGALYKWLNRRSQRGGMTWARLLRILKKTGFPRQVRPRNLFYCLSAAGPQARA
jgi:hypothetical protein